MSAPEYLLGFDLGSSSIKVSLLNAATGQLVAAASAPGTEMPMLSVKSGWAEQDPEMWWTHTIAATHQVLKTAQVPTANIKGIGISYQMHGLVVVDKQLKILRPSIIWCDSRAVTIGEQAEKQLGEEYCQQHLLNSPGNFTASKLKWVRDNEPDIYSRIYKVMLPGDYLALRMTGVPCTTVSGLSEGMMWDYHKKAIATDLLDLYGIDKSLIADIVPTFGEQGRLTAEAAATLGLHAGTPVSYRAGDQPNNAFSLKTLHPGEIAATAGTSGVIYGIVDRPASDKQSRVNAFIHVNNTDNNQRLGVLLCVNGTGIMNSWLRRHVQITGDAISYDKLNGLAASAPIGAEKLYILPFGNGAERMLENRDLGASFHGLNLNRHGAAHLCRAVQEGIVYSLGYGFEILNQMGLQSTVIRAGRANMFLSDTFCEAFTNVTGARIELYNTDGSQGAARGAGAGIGHYSSLEAAFDGLTCLKQYEPEKNKQAAYREAFAEWKQILEKQLHN